MDIETAADWATVIAVGIAPILGGVWLWWTRRRQNKRVKRAIDIMRLFEENRKSAYEYRQKVMNDSESSDAKQTIAFLREIDMTIQTIWGVLILHFLHTHQRRSELPEWLSGLHLQSPIAKRDEPK